MSGAEYQIQQRYIQTAESMYGHAEADVKADNARFDTFLAADAELEARMRESIIQADDRPAATPSGTNTCLVSYPGDSSIEVRAVVGDSGRKVLANIPRARVLEVGASPVTMMYAKVLDDIDLFSRRTCPAGNPPDGRSPQRYGFAGTFLHRSRYRRALRRWHPRLVEQQFHIVLFCEVIEHVLASPQEMLYDLLQLVAPGGVLIVTTPNGMSARRLFDVVIGRKGDSFYRRNQKELHQHHHIHVREYTSARDPRGGRRFRRPGAAAGDREELFTPTRLKISS